ncbi:TetR/AcrR family transcriptional regulator, partial [Acinetobacter baumannii]|nr:TetR/AcrR family transcriptional regulator [Acinetobacter baumannii]MDQ9933421.1 TetR/AcrR family transcriptional regulator [Acinetobacter baumannii]
ASLLLNSTYYQRSIGSRQKLINLYINQALSLPTQTTNFDALNFQIEDENSQN